jgi:hypothetical protein
VANNNTIATTNIEDYHCEIFFFFDRYFCYIWDIILFSHVLNLITIFLGWLISVSVFALILFCLRENRRNSSQISQLLNSIERYQDRIEYLEESLYEFY